MVNVEEKVARAKALRQTAIDQLQLITDAAKKAKNDVTLKNRFKVAYRNVKTIQKVFDKHHNALLALICTDPTQLSAENEIATKVMTLLQDVETTYYEMFDLSDEVTSLASSPAHNSTMLGQCLPQEISYLPKPNLPMFNGDIKTFPTFIQSFDSLYHSNRSISNLDKLKCLRMCLQGTPLDLISDLPVLGENYIICYKILQDRYNNRRLQVVTHWKEIENCPSLIHENAQQLRNLLDTFNKNIAALRSLKMKPENFDFILMQFLIDRLDSNTRKMFEQHHSSNDIPLYNDVNDFLLKHCTALESMPSKKDFKPSHDFSQKQSPRNSNLNMKPQHKKYGLMTQQQKTTNICLLCGPSGQHLIYRCSDFLSKTPRERYEIILNNRACVNCLSKSHQQNSCKSLKRCLTCRGFHHSLVHDYDLIPTSAQAQVFSKINQSGPPACPLQASSSSSSVLPVGNQSQNQDFHVGFSKIKSQTSVFYNNYNQQVKNINESSTLLSTIWLKIRDNFGQWHSVRAIGDSGAEASFLSKSLAKKLKLPKLKTDVSLKGLDSMNSKVKFYVQGTIGSLYEPNFTFDSDFLVVENICEYSPPSSFNFSKFEFLKTLKLADQNFNQSGKIDILLGNDIWPYALRDGRIYSSPDQPVCYNTVFGWTIGGKICAPTNLPKSLQGLLTICPNNTLSKTLQKFWEIEEVPCVKSVSPEDSFCENYYQKTTKRNAEGRYIVSLPFKISCPDFGDTRALALKRFFSLEKRLLKNKTYYETYSDVFRDYVEQNHMQAVPRPVDSEIHNYFYISHHAVFKEESSSTPLRIVFNASGALPKKCSLNSAVHAGPKLQADIVKILLNFRLHKVALVCDLRQMFRNILVENEQRNFQRILWRFSPNSPVEDFQINTLLFGVSSSPFLAIRTLLQLANDYDDLPYASKVLRNYTYIDDCVFSFRDIDTASTAKNQLIQLLKRGGFEARKWASNYPSLLSDLPESHVQNQALSFEAGHDDFSLKILGLKWNPQTDHFFFTIACSQNSQECTKRSILSFVARLYDPCGFLTPVTFFAKFLIQHLWSLGQDWDEKVPNNISEIWQNYLIDFSNLKKFQISRELEISNAESIQLIGFSDSSEKGYCAVTYLRVVYKDKSIKTFFICGKSKVAPLKRQSLPRLELCACVLLSKLMHFILETFSEKIQFSNIYAFTDSTVALQWIKASPHVWQTFISNRVSYIQEKISANYWYHVPSAQNAADCGSRGLLPSELINFELWKYGPSFLLTPEKNWTFLQIELSKSKEALEEKRLQIFTSVKSKHFIDELFLKYSSLGKIKRIVAYFLRAVALFKIKRQDRVPQKHLVLSELHSATIFLTKHVQATFLQNEIVSVQNKQIPKSLKKLDPFIDKSGLLRLGGRICNSSLSYDQKFPILLPKSCKFTDLLIYEIHRTHLHCSIHATHFLILQNFWILSAKKAISSVLSRCLICWRTKPDTFQPKMGNLPRYRFIEDRAFLHAGVDLCGPFQLHVTARLRNSVTVKAYVALFICLSVKAVHLELVSSLSAEAFLNALRRFFARRGKSKAIYSDCGTNFIASDKYLRQIFASCLETEAVEWHFNVPTASHMAGIWEANIKCVKKHITRVVGLQILTYEELSTVLAQIEAVLNSRPISAISSDPSDLSALTPGHFLSLAPLTTIPDPDFTQIQTNRLARWQLLQKMHRDFWNRWRNEYLHTLQQRSKWHESNFSSVKPGTLVLIKDDNLNPLEWSVARIIEIIFGSDKIPRVAVVKTAKGTLKRPLVKLCPLPDPAC